MPAGPHNPPAPPILRFHAPTKTHYVWLGRNKGGRKGMGRDFAKAQANYQRFCDEWRAARGHPGVEGDPRAARTVSEVLVAYWRHRRREKIPAKTLAPLKTAIRLARKHHGSDAAVAFRAPVLKQLRKRMLRTPCRRKRKDEAAPPLSRVYVNRLVNFLKAAWRWAASEDLVPTEVADNLATVGAIRKHRGGRELLRVTDVEPWAVAATLPELHQVAADMVRIQQLAGMRPKELCLLRRRDVSTSAAELVPLPETRKKLAAQVADDVLVWVAIPESHKTQWRGPKPRVIVLGPQAQKILKPYLDRPPDAYLFSPREASDRWRADRERAAVYAADRTPGDHYTTESYGRAVKAAIARANKKRVELLPHAEPVPDWRPNQLRHSAATAAAEKFDRATASAMLGNGMDVIDRYVEQELGRAARAAAAIG